MDVLWMRLSRRESDPESLLGRIAGGYLFIQIDRGDYWQCAFVIAKGTYGELRKRGLHSLREEIARLAPDLASRTSELETWDDVKLLTVVVDRLARWHVPGLLCIGDAAHAMSPIGGVGVNLAIQDAVAAANRLHEPLARGTLDESHLAAVQRRRERPTRWTQALQVGVQRAVIAPLLGARGRKLPVPPPIWLLDHVPVLRRIPAYVIGLGFRSEHVRSPAAGVEEPSAR